MNRFRRYVTIIIGIFWLRYSDATVSPIIRIDGGYVQGAAVTLQNNQTVYTYRGIPYADPPVNGLRFREPQPKKPWQGVWNATYANYTCLQYMEESPSIAGNEDCLYLNVLTPMIPKNNESLLPVLFIIPGGGYQQGSGLSTDPYYLIQKYGIVAVGINYRVSLFGFFSTGDGACPGNNGLKDQVFALEWVKRNIMKFGGDPQKVTTMGYSAGGSSVHYHYLSPLTDGLFRNGFAISGTAGPPWTLPTNNTEKSIQLARIMGCPTDNSRITIECMRSRGGADLIAQMVATFIGWVYSPFTIFGPVVEPENSTGAYLTDDPMRLLHWGKYKKNPLLVSLSEGEGVFPGKLFIGREDYLTELDQQWNRIAPYLLQYTYDVSSVVESDRISQEIRSFYFGNASIAGSESSEIIQMLGDRHFYNDVTRAARLQAADDCDNVFAYFFQYRGKYATNATFNNTVGHAGNWGYIISDIPPENFENEEDGAMLEYLTSMTYKFMETGNPTRSGSFGNVQWDPVSNNPNELLRLLYIESTSNQRMESYNDTETFVAWKGWFPAKYSLEPV